MQFHEAMDAEESSEAAVDRALLAACAVVLAVGLGFVGWRTVTPAECAWVGSDAGSWLDGGVRPSVAPGDLECAVRTGETILGAEVQGAEAVLTRSSGRPVTVPLDPPGRQLLGRLVSTGSTLAFCLGFAGLSAYAALRRRRRSSLTLLLAASALLGSTLAYAAGLPVHAAFDGTARWLYAVNVQAVFLLAWGATAAWLLLFPTPLLDRPVQHRAWLAALLAPTALWALAAALVAATAEGFTGWMRTSVVVQSSLTVIVVAASLVALVARVRRALGAPPGDVARQQVLWVAGSALVSGTLTLALWMLPQLLTGAALLPDDLIGAPGLVFVLGLAVATARYRLFDLDVVLGRTLVYGVLVLVAVTVYLVVTGTVAALVGSRDSTPVVAAVLLALLLNPLRVRFERVVDRAFYGERNDPYSALSRIATRIADRGATLEEVAGEVARALRTSHVAITTDGATVESGPRPPPGREPVTFSIRHDEEEIGTLVVAPRVAGERFSRAERRLLDDVAQQIGHRVRERRLVRELHESRERLVIAREEERRVLRRTLHDEIGPAMAAVSLRAETGRRLLARRPPAEGGVGAADVREVDAVLSGIAQDASATATSLRDLSYRLRPPALDEHGLVEALHLQAGSMAPIELRVEAHDAEGAEAAEPLGAAVEAAAYRIAVAALANVTAHARARVCHVTLTRSADDLVLLVEDDGVGLTPGTPRGVGLSGMGERAAELGGRLTLEPRDGGGLRVRAQIPTGGAR